MLSPLGERIEHILDGRTGSWLAEKAGLNSSTLHDMMTRASPGADKVLKVAKALGTSVEYLMTGEEPAARAQEAAEAPAGWFPSDARIGAVAQSFGERLRKAELALDEATQETAIIPDEGMRQALLTLHVRYGVLAEDLALLLHAAERSQIRRK